MLAQLTVQGFLTDKPETRTINNGNTVTSASIAYTPRVKVGGEWQDGSTLFIRVTVWGKDGEMLAYKADKGDLVIASGDLIQESYKTKSGEERSSLKLTARTIGIVSTKADRQSVSNGGGGSVMDAITEAAPF